MYNLVNVKSLKKIYPQLDPQQGSETKEGGAHITIISIRSRIAIH